ncbi:MAG: hypothetical protein F6K47_27565 [Symploca sp. SIO2E6]|nr:hypothetical protein [Symploca sp. SIO2E6]
MREIFRSHFYPNLSQSSYHREHLRLKFSREEYLLGLLVRQILLAESARVVKWQIHLKSDRFLGFGSSLQETRSTNKCRRTA